MEQQFKTVITANSKWINLHLKETYEYRDLIFLFVRRDFISKYKPVSYTHLRAHET